MHGESLQIRIGLFVKLLLVSASIRLVKQHQVLRELVRGGCPLCQPLRDNHVLIARTITAYGVEQLHFLTTKTTLTLLSATLPSTSNFLLSAYYSPT